MSKTRKVALLCSGALIVFHAGIAQWSCDVDPLAASCFSILPGPEVPDEIMGEIAGDTITVSSISPMPLAALAGTGARVNLSGRTVIGGQAFSQAD
jgi:hypothetical protein